MTCISFSDVTISVVLLQNVWIVYIPEEEKIDMGQVVNNTLNSVNENTNCSNCKGTGPVKI